MGVSLSAAGAIAGSTGTALHAWATAPEAIIAGDCQELISSARDDSPIEVNGSIFWGTDLHGQLFALVFKADTREWEWWVVPPNQSNTICQFGAGEGAEIKRHIDPPLITTPTKRFQDSA